MAGASAGRVTFSPCAGGRFAGRMRIAGTCLYNGAGVVRKILLIAEADKQVVRQTVSASDGTFTFSNIAPGNYFVIGLDESYTENSVIAAHITAVT